MDALMLVNQPRRVVEQVLGLRDPSEAPEDWGEYKTYVYRPDGVELRATRSDIVSTVFLFARGRDGDSAYRGSLPDGIRFSDSREAVRQKLGKPSFVSAHGEPIAVLGTTPPVDRFDLDTHSVSVQYSDDLTRVVLVNVNALETQADSTPDDATVDPQIVLCVLHDDPEVIRGISEETEGSRYSEAYSGGGPDTRMPAAFEVSEDSICPTMTVAEKESIRAHQNVAYVESPAIDPHDMRLAIQYLGFIERCFDAGARAVKCESSGLTHGRAEWLRLASMVAEHRDVNSSLLRAWVRYPLREKNLYHTTGMHLLGHADVEIVGESESQAADVLGKFAVRLLEMGPGNANVSGQIFRLGEKCPSYRVNLHWPHRYPVGDLFSNPIGVWRLTRVLI